MQQVTPITKSQSLLNHAIESLNNLIDCSYFDTHRVYKDIIKRLKTDAIYSKNIPYTTALKELIRNGKLKRDQENHQWAYYNPAKVHTTNSLNGYGIKDEYFAQFASGGMHNFFLLQVDLANHTKWFREKKPEKNLAKKDLAMLLTNNLRDKYQFHRLFWAGDGGVFVRTSEATKNYDLVVEAADKSYELFEKWKKKYRKLETKLLNIRISAHISQVFTDKDPGFWTSEELNNFIKYERDISEEGFAITEQIRDKLTASKQKRFVSSGTEIKNKDEVTIMLVFNDSIHRL